jgi:hypothetical protein
MLYSIEFGNITVSTHYHRMYQEQQKICTLHGCATDYFVVYFLRSSYGNNLARQAGYMCISCCELHKKCHVLSDLNFYSSFSLSPISSFCVVGCWYRKTDAVAPRLAPTQYTTTCSINVLPRQPYFREVASTGLR